VASKLKDAGEWLTGRSLSGEPELYLWGQRIDVKGRERGMYEPLRRVRAALESGIARFGTEPDIMLVVKGEMVICIEAKFGSGNPLAYAKRGRNPRLARACWTDTLAPQRLRERELPFSLKTWDRGSLVSFSAT
jgi:hypothetical protein